MCVCVCVDRYPFESPIIRVVEGDDVVPSAAMMGDMIVMPGSDSWTPSNTILATLEVVLQQTRRHHGRVATKQIQLDFLMNPTLVNVSGSICSCSCAQRILSPPPSKPLCSIGVLAF